MLHIIANTCLHPALLKNDLVTFCAPHRVVIYAASLQERLGLKMKDAELSVVWLTRDKFGMTFFDQLGLINLRYLLELSKSF